jgi:hypothetical protein
MQWGGGQCRGNHRSQPQETAEDRRDCREPNLPCPVLQPSFCLGRIQVSSTTWGLLGAQEEWESTGGIEVKGKGIMQASQGQGHAGFNT